MNKTVTPNPAKASVLSDRCPFYLFYASVFLVLLILSAMTPMVSDDFAYCFSWTDWTRIRSIAQIIPSMAEHRNVTNGRVVVHGLVQLLLLLPRPVYCVLNALNGVLLCTLVRRLIRLPVQKQALCILLSGVFCIACFLPAFGENILWLDGSLNYFWGLSCSLLFLFPYLAAYLDVPPQKKNRFFPLQKDSPVSPTHGNHIPELQPEKDSADSGMSRVGNTVGSFLRILLAFVFGTWSENTSLVLLFLACCLFFLQWKRTRQFQLWPMLWIIAAMAGYVFLMAAPATASRAGASSVSVIGYNLRVVFKAAKTYLLWPLLIDAALFALTISFRGEKRLLIVSGLLIVCALLVHLSYAFAAYFVPRHLCTAVFLLQLASLLLLSELCRVQGPVFSRVALACLTVLFVLQFPVGVLDIAVSFHKQQLREQQIDIALASGQRSVLLENYFPYTAYAVPFELNPTDPSVGPNINVSDYYGLDEVLGVDPLEES